jgi:hypothetical protein
MRVNRWTLISLFVLDVALFALAAVTSKTSSHPGTVSNVFWGAFLVGVALLIVLGIVALVRSRLPARER